MRVVRIATDFELDRLQPQWNRLAGNVPFRMWQGRPIAVEFQLLDDTTVYAYQTGMAPDQLDLHPGRLSCMIGIQLAITAGQTGYDFLRGDEPYKAHWRATRRCVRDVRVVPRKPLALVRHATWLAVGQAKRSVKSGLAALRLRTPDESDRGRAESTFPNRARAGDGDARVAQPDIRSAPTDGDP